MTRISASTIDIAFNVLNWRPAVPSLAPPPQFVEATFGQAVGRFIAMIVSIAANVIFNSQVHIEGNNFTANGVIAPSVRLLITTDSGDSVMFKVKGNRLRRDELPVECQNGLCTQHNVQFETLGVQLLLAPFDLATPNVMTFTLRYTRSEFLVEENSYYEDIAPVEAQPLLWTFSNLFVIRTMSLNTILDDVSVLISKNKFTLLSQMIHFEKWPLVIGFEMFPMGVVTLDNQSSLQIDDNTIDANITFGNSHFSLPLTYEMALVGFSPLAPLSMPGHAESLRAVGASTISISRNRINASFKANITMLDDVSDPYVTVKGIGTPAHISLAGGSSFLIEGNDIQGSLDSTLPATFTAVALGTPTQFTCSDQRPPADGFTALSGVPSADAGTEAAPPATLAAFLGAVPGDNNAPGSVFVDDASRLSVAGNAVRFAIAAPPDAAREALIAFPAGASVFVSDGSAVALSNNSFETNSGQQRGTSAAYRGIFAEGTGLSVSGGSIFAVDGNTHRITNAWPEEPPIGFRRTLRGADAPRVRPINTMPSLKALSGFPALVDTPFHLWGPIADLIVGGIDGDESQPRAPSEGRRNAPQAAGGGEPLAPRYGPIGPSPFADAFHACGANFQGTTLLFGATIVDEKSE